MPVDNYISLSQLTGQIKAVLDTAFFNKTFWVLADVVDYRYQQQKDHHYFALVEKNSTSHAIIAKITTTAWGHGAMAIESFQRITGQKFRNNINVLVNVTVKYHDQHGLSLCLNDVDTTYTIGQLELQRQNTINKLLAECSEFIQLVGEKFVTKNKSLELPFVIQNIAVVTSNNSAGYKDFIDTLAKNKEQYLVNIDPFFTTVQGEANAEALFQRLLDVHKANKPYDAVVIIRGGGSQTDFLIFDQYNIARAVAKFPIPIISGIGHQINETIVDLMAHTSVKTPSIAAEFIIGHNREFEAKLVSLQKTILIKSQQIIKSKQDRLTVERSSVINSARNMLTFHKDALTNSYQVAVNQSKEIIRARKSMITELSGRILARPRLLVGNKKNDLTNLLQNLKSFTRMYFVNNKGYLNHYVAITRIMSPLNILKKGFAIVYQNEKIVVEGKNIKPSNQINVRLLDSEIKATVNLNTPKNGSEYDL
jgi:exodeoxyribonuclease VII large subunit